MSGLRFSFQEMLDEISSFAGLANGFITPQSSLLLFQFRSQLEGYRNSTTASGFDWEIEEINPLQTIPTKDYEPGGGGAALLVGEITSKWRIKKEAPKKKSMASQHFQLLGLASTRVRIRTTGSNTEAPKEIAMWRMELGDSKSPGCYFHTQILGQSDDPPFPKSLPVPRLPILVMTPLAVAEFMLGELFQDQWEPHTARTVPHLNRWAPIQHERFNRLLDWKKSLLKGSVGTPWSSLKKGQPDTDLFIPGKKK
ncbi:hypothetical protein SAMN05216330_103614 [Bradyrhizobium sp. Ghvi]|uniref:hypothetical protein n=1 Tax=Bradyrhizobium sp. Ghvi TaxID=1855319 RepID=UPI0008E619BD|nr:hypothetical protein [Bradyrhizobium sp. Ghvi]SFO55822.1 hypothetical protein SAMN05216330_103614 [Bradyrhizobium sp. Ghvi]